MNDHASSELKLFIDNDAQLYSAQHVPILKNLAAKKIRSQYKHDLAVKLFGNLVESGAKKYAKEFGSPNPPWHKMFDIATRKLVAEDLTRDFEDEFELGNYDNLLPKKYQRELAKQHLVPPRAHARKAKSMGDYEAEGYKAHTWHVANCPYSQPKIRDAWQRGAWKWQQEQRAARPTKVTLAHATRSGHAHARKSPSRFDREIANVVPSWRGGR